MQRVVRTAARRAGPVAAAAAALQHDGIKDDDQSATGNVMRLKAKLAELRDDVECERETVWCMHKQQDKLMTEIDRLRKRNAELERLAAAANGRQRGAAARPANNGGGGGDDAGNGNGEALDWVYAIGAGIIGAVVLVGLVMLRAR